jgi:hypothetical protein
MALSDLPGVGTFQASKPVIAQPLDLQPAIDKMMKAYDEGFISAEDLKKRSIEGTSGAKATRSENEARQAKAETYKKTGDPAQRAKDAAERAKAEQDRVDQEGQAAPGGAAPKTPYLDRALEGDFNPKHWSTADLEKIAQQAGYQVIQNPDDERLPNETQESWDYRNRPDVKERRQIMDKAAYPFGHPPKFGAAQ